MDDMIGRWKATIATLQREAPQGVPNAREWYGNKRGRNGKGGLWRPSPYDGVDQNLGSIKTNMPPFQGKNDSEKHITNRVP